MKEVIDKSKSDAEFFFNHECKDDPSKQKLSQHDFTRMVKSLWQKAIPLEIAHLFRHFDPVGKGYASK